MWLSDNVCPANFNSRPSARGDGTRRTSPGTADISIHAPPRGATHGAQFERADGHLFQFTPLREGRPAPRQGKRHAPYFNSRPSARGDRACRFLVFCGFPFQFTPLREGRRGTRRTSPGTADISIHAPPRGATEAQEYAASVTEFQFTPLREGRLDAPIGDAIHIDFNSRPSARGDEMVDRKEQDK